MHIIWVYEEKHAKNNSFNMPSNSKLFTPR